MSNNPINNESDNKNAAVISHEVAEPRYMETARDMNLLFMAQSAGVVYFKPRGLKLYENLKNFIRAIHREAGYQEVRSPSIVVQDLFVQSGHMEKYRENMFLLGEASDDYALRPMSCPNHILIYSSDVVSYKDLPVQLFEFGEVFRNEANGALQALFRQRQFVQDDSHVFCDANNIKPSIKRFIDMARKAYSELGFEQIKFAISLRPEKRFGSDDLWDKAENNLREACRESGLEAEEIPNGGAFYGPKLEIQVEDKLGRWWQLGVIQIDYVLPERFNIHFTDENNERVTPVILHHAVLGSLERMIGILLESFGKNLPDFLHPNRDVVLAINSNVAAFAQVVADKLGCEVDNDNDTLSKKILKHKHQGVKNVYIVGEKEKARWQAEGVVVAQIHKQGLVEL